MIINRYLAKVLILMGKVGVAGLTTPRTGVRGVKICTLVFLVTLTPNEPKSTKKSLWTIKSYGRSYPDRADHTNRFRIVFEGRRSKVNNAWVETQPIWA